MENSADGDAVFVIRLRPDLVRHPNIQSYIADVLISLYCLFGQYNPDAEYVWIAEGDDGDLWLAIVEFPPEEEEPEDLTPPLTRKIPAAPPTEPGSGLSEEDLADL